LRCSLLLIWRPATSTLLPSTTLFRSFPLAGTAGHDSDIGVWCKCVELVLPIVDEGGRRHDDERLFCTILHLAHYIGDCLQRLAKPHIIGQDTAEAIAG